MLVCMCVSQIFGSRVRVDSTAKVAEIEMAEKEKMKEKVDRILKHGISCFINRYTHGYTHSYTTTCVYLSMTSSPSQTADLQLPRAAVRSGRRHGHRARRLRRRGAPRAGHWYVHTHTRSHTHTHPLNCRLARRRGDQLHLRPPGAGEARPLQADRGGDDRRGHAHPLLWGRHGYAHTAHVIMTSSWCSSGHVTL